MPKFATYPRRGRRASTLASAAIAVFASCTSCTRTSATEPRVLTAAPPASSAAPPASASSVLPTAEPYACVVPPAPLAPAPLRAAAPPDAEAAPEQLYDERRVRALLSSQEFAEPPTSFGDDLPLFRTVERFGLDDEPSTIHTLFAVLFASHDDRRLQRAALFSLVRRAPASLELAAKLLDAEVPEVSRLFRVAPEVTPAVQRSYERALAAAVLGASGLESARTPLRAASSNATALADRVLFSVALSRVTSPAEASRILLGTLAQTPQDAAVEYAHASGLVQLVAGLEDLLLPCSFEIMQMGSPPLDIELLAKVAEERAVEQAAPALLELAQRVGTTNARASDNLASSAALLADPSTFATLRDWVQRLPPDADRNIKGWVDDIAPAYSRCEAQLACHLCVLNQPDVEMWHYKSALFVAARLAPDQGAELIPLMERMARPFWLVEALDARLTAPTSEQIARVRRLPRPDADETPLYAPRTSSCARLESPFEELAIRLEVRAKSGNEQR